MLNITVLVSGGGTNLQALIDAEKTGILKNGKINLVVSSKPDVFALKRAEKAEIKTFVVDKKNFNNSTLFCNELLKILKENNTDLIVLAGFMTILTTEFIKQYSNRIINVHPSLIPSFCGEGFYGLKVHQAALDYGVKVTGATVHFVNEIVDGGKIIAQKALEISQDDTAQSLQKKVMENCEWIILPLATEKVCKEINNQTL
ncbi:MAG: phosphoribosylglycinamide formyltransferase [Oscillospiraceae bacterium]